MTADQRASGQIHYSRRVVQTAIVIAWILLIAAVALMESARPEMETFLDRRHHKVARSAWDMDLANPGFSLLWIGLAVCAVGLIVEISRKRRFGVPISRFLLMASLLTLLALVIYWQSV